MSTLGDFLLFIEAGSQEPAFRLGDWPCCDFPLQVCVEIDTDLPAGLALGVVDLGEGLLALGGDLPAEGALGLGVEEALPAGVGLFGLDLAACGLGLGGDLPAEGGIGLDKGEEPQAGVGLDALPIAEGGLGLFHEEIPIPTFPCPCCEENEMPGSFELEIESVDFPELNGLILTPSFETTPGVFCAWTFNGGLYGFEGLLIVINSQLPNGSLPALGVDYDAGFGGENQWTFSGELSTFTCTPFGFSEVVTLTNALAETKTITIKSPPD